MSDTESKALEEEKLALAMVGIGVVFAQTLVSLNQQSGALPLLRERAEAMQRHLDAISPPAATMMGVFARALYDERFFPGTPPEPIAA